MKTNKKALRRIRKTALGGLLLSALLVLTLGALILLTGCGTAGVKNQVIPEPTKIGSLSGPTGIGMVYLMEKPEKYQVSVYQTPDEVAAKVISGQLEVAAVPSNLGAVLFNKLEGKVVLLATNTLGTLYILENGEGINDLADLKGKTILASGKGGTPEYILKRILTDGGMDPAKDFTVKWLMSHADVATAVASGEGVIGMLPQPFATVAAEKNTAVKTRFDLDEEWQRATGTVLPMGVLVAQKSFVESRRADLTMFLDEYKASVIRVNADPRAASLLLAKYGIIANAAVAEKAIPLCHIVYIPAQSGKADLERFFESISAENPTAIGGKMPDETFYYDPEK
jgi:NitT/TauT family transport system substrate-binding protein